MSAMSCRPKERSMIFPNTLLTNVASPMPALVPTDYLWRLTVDQYHEMIRVGILPEGDPIELLEGLLVAKMPKKPTHSGVNQILRVRLDGIVLAAWHVRVQDPV